MISIWKNESRIEEKNNPLFFNQKLPIQIWIWFVYKLTVKQFS